MYHFPEFVVHFYKIGIAKERSGYHQALYIQVLEFCRYEVDHNFMLNDNRINTMQTEMAFFDKQKTRGYFQSVNNGLT